MLAERTCWSSICTWTELPGACTPSVWELVVGEIVPVPTQGKLSKHVTLGHSTWLLPCIYVFFKLIYFVLENTETLNTMWDKVFCHIM